MLRDAGERTAFRLRQAVAVAHLVRRGADVAARSFDLRRSVTDPTQPAAAGEMRAQMAVPVLVRALV